MLTRIQVQSSTISVMSATDSVKVLWSVEDNGADGVAFGVFPPKVLQCRAVSRSH